MILGKILSFNPVLNLSSQHQPKAFSVTTEGGRYKNYMQFLKDKEE
jgi:hypothetical protein